MNRPPLRRGLFPGLILLLCGGLSMSFLEQGSAQGLPEVDAIVVDGLMWENWPDPAVIGFRRPDGTGELTVNFSLGGTASRGIDYTVPDGDSILFPDGVREVWLSFTPLTDSATERTETIQLNLQPGVGYLLPATVARRSVRLLLYDIGARPGAKEASRFLWQAAFGPSADSSKDGDIIPETVERVTELGFEKWIAAQFRTKPRYHRPMIDAMIKAKRPVYWDAKMRPWWERAIGPTAADPLRQRVAFALSEIFVISDRLETLSGQPRGMVSYYDMLVKHAFGNARGLLRDVALHPCMGVYLSHLKNRKADPDLGTFPDENFAREVMQLFSIGLWMLNEDGTLMLDGSGDPIPTYDNEAITNFARVFTGLSFGGSKGTQFWWPQENWISPMRMWDEYHDMDPKILLNGVVLPARSPSIPDRGTAGMADIEGAIDCLFLHPNTGPFLTKQLIQKLVTSNPSPEYVGRVSAVFADNGAGVRGDMKAVIRAVLLDPEARAYSNLASATYGKMKEPYLRTAGLARAFNARSAARVYDLSYLDDIHFQQPYSSPSVFNFFRPGYSPAGAISDAGLVAPEFQVLNSISAISLPNYYFNVVRYGFNRWGHSNPKMVVMPNLKVEMSLWNDVPALMRRLDLALTGGTLDPVQHQTIREAVEAIDSTYWDWKRERIFTAIYLISTLPEVAIQR
ncbi:MAG: DUF1800 family protein [Verrucomicrobiae bacterium]|nr:DUF1800 family protein [Verrucomicrobiae bacterium]